VGNLTVSNDAFNNTIHAGYIDELHNFFEFESKGVVILSNYYLKEPLNPIFGYPSNYTQPDDNIRRVLEQINLPSDASLIEKVFALSAKIQELIVYQAGVTNIQTTACHALILGKGVCQDYAHVLISLCRLSGIPARYVTGFMQGEGFTHAWIEYYNQGGWYGFDPTHHNAIETGYIKIAHGRDYADCAMDRGVFTGVAQQHLEVYLNVAMEQ